jgi:PAS domain-containing protein
MEAGGGKHIVLILARELANNLATPLFIVDAQGTIVFFNEPAEHLFGQSFSMIGELPADRWTALFRAETAEGVPLAARERPFALALKRRRPSHRRMVLVSPDGVRRPVVVTTYPLMASGTELVGALAVLWKDDGAGTG